MADLSTLATAIEGLRLDVQKAGQDQIQSIDRIGETFQDLSVFTDGLLSGLEELKESLGSSLDMSSSSDAVVAELQALREALTGGDALADAQQTEREREQQSNSAIQQEIQQPSVQPSKGIGKKLLIGGAIAAGVAGIIGSISALLDFDADEVKRKIVVLLSIKDEVADGSLLKMLGEAGTFALAMAGIGAGLAAFGAGSAIAGGGMALADWTSGEDWAQSIKDSVVTLLSIKDELGGNLKMIMDGGAFMLAMAGVGLGLAAFGAGAFAGGAGLGFADWAGGDDWAQSIKDSVITLLSIKDELGGNIEMLADGGAFMLTMAGIGLGLAAFAIGKGAAGVADAVHMFSEGDFADNIVKEVKTLLSIMDDENISVEKANEFNSVLGSIAGGLAKFAGGKFLDALAGAGAGILNFISGNDSPIEAMTKIADKADDLTKGADALERIRQALSGLGGLKFDGSDFNISDLTDDLMKSIPALEVAINGGTVGEGFFTSGTEIKGLASPDIDYATATKRIAEIQMALNAQVPITASPTDVSTQVTPQSNQSTGGGVAVNNVVAPVTNNSAPTTMISQRNQHTQPDMDALMF